MDFHKLTKNEKIITVAKYIINNKATINTVADYYDISTSCVKKYINDDSNLKSIDPLLYEKVKVVQQGIIKMGNYIGAKTGKRNPSITDYEAEEMAMKIIENHWTLDEAESFFEVPRSTIFENVKKISDKDLLEELQEVFLENKINSIKK